jgi:hypothetical protein
MMLFDEDVQDRIHRTTEKEIIRMKEKIFRFQRKLAHLQDVYNLTKPASKIEAVQIDMFGG